MQVILEDIWIYFGRFLMPGSVAIKQHWHTIFVPQKVFIELK